MAIKVLLKVRNLRLDHWPKAFTKATHYLRVNREPNECVTRKKEGKNKLSIFINNINVIRIWKKTKIRGTAAYTAQLIKPLLVFFVSSVFILVLSKGRRLDMFMRTIV